MEVCYIKQEPNIDMCDDFESNHDFKFNSMSFKSEDNSNDVILNQSIKYEFCTDNFNEKSLRTDNNLNAIIKEEPCVIMKEDEELTEDEDFELRLSDTSVEDEDKAGNVSIPDLSAITSQLKCTKIYETPNESNVMREEAVSKIDKVAMNETPKNTKTMKQTSLLSFFKQNACPSVETRKTPRSRKSGKVKPAKLLLDPIEILKLSGARVVLERLPDSIIGTFSNSKGSVKNILRHCAKCKMDYPDLKLSRNNRCVHCSEAIAFRCGQCSKIYRAQSSIRYHLDFQCPVRREIMCQQDKGTPKSNAKLKCDKCQMLFSNSKTLSQHQKLFCSKVLCCEHCDFKTVNVLVFRAHRGTHAAAKTEIGSKDAEISVQPYCTTCEKFRANSRYVKKCYKCKSMLSFKCAKCDLMFTAKKEAQDHTKIHDKRMTHACEDCSKAFSSPVNVKKHKKYCSAK